MFGACLSLLLLAQAPESTYDRYALRLVYGPGSTGVVRGIQTEAVGGGTFVPGVDLLATADDSVRLQYRASRASFKRYALLGGISIAGALATMNYYGGHLHHDWNAPIGIGLPLTTLLVGWAGSANAAGGEDHLRRAIWLYNRRFQRAPDSASSDCAYDRCALRVQRRLSSTQIVRGIDGAPLGEVELSTPLRGVSHGLPHCPDSPARRPRCGAERGDPVCGRAKQARARLRRGVSRCGIRRRSWVGIRDRPGR